MALEVWINEIPLIVWIDCTLFQEKKKKTDAPFKHDSDTAKSTGRLAVKMLNFIGVAQPP